MFALYTNHNRVFFTKLHNHDWYNRWELPPRYGSNDPATYAGEMGIVEDEPVPCRWNFQGEAGG
jgi:hypothetical protein